MKILSKTSTDRTNERTSDKVFRILSLAGAVVILIIMLGLFIELFNNSLLSIKKFGINFLIADIWNPVKGEFGAAASIWGTLISTLIAMIIALPLGILIAFALVELLPQKISNVIGTAIELLAAVPSIIYGMWGLFVFAPFMANYIQPVLQSIFGETGLFAGPPLGIGMLTAGIILAFMILPFIASVIRDIFLMVPAVVKESAHGMGSTLWEVTSKVTLRYGMQGIIGGAMLGLGRAIGETMAVTFVIGNSHKISTSLFAPANSITATLANEFAEASEPLYLSSLIELGLILFLITFIIQVFSQLWLKKIKKTMGVQ